MLLLAAVLSLLQNDADAEKLLREAQERVGAAKTLRASITMGVGRGGEEFQARLRILVKGERWILESDAQGPNAENAQAHLLSDGRTVRSLKPGKEAPRTLSAAALREGVHTTTFPIFMHLQAGGRGRNPGNVRPVLEKIKDGGTEERDGRQLRIVAASFKLPGIFGDQPASLKMHIDPKDRRVVRRELDLFGTTLVETIDVAIDEEIADDEFAFQTLRRLNQGRAEQAAGAVDAFTRYTGRLPASPDELAARPAWLAPEHFWPDGGFALGKVPRDPWGRPYEIAPGPKPALRSRGADARPGGRGDAEDVEIPLRPPSGRAVGAPSERLRRHFETRVRLLLLSATVTGYSTSYGELPRKKADLWERGGAEVWPEGGWLPGGMPNDGWGDVLRMISEADVVRLQIQDPKARRIPLKELTAEERAGLDAAARLRVSDVELAELRRLMDALAEDDFEKREKADEALRAKGPSAVGPLDERIRTEKDAEARARLGMIRKSLRIPPAPWPGELGLLQAGVRLDGRPGGDASRTAFAGLKTLASAEADFRGNDRDDNKMQDFWTGDVASLYTLKPPGSTEMMKLIELGVAAADGAPLNDGAALEGLTERRAHHGYLYRAMLGDPAGPYHAGGHRNASRFGFTCYPEDYGVGGTLTAIISEQNTVYVKDTGGEPVLEWPGDAELRTWSKLD